MNPLPKIETVLTMFVIYDHPKDFPNHIVIRRHHVMAQSPPQADAHAFLFNTISEARHWVVSQGLVNIGRMGDDDQKILEVWI